jgi:TonB family protein
VRISRISLVACTLTLIVSGVSAQNTSSSDQSPWQRYTVKNEQFSVAFPAVPVMDYRRSSRGLLGDRLEISLGSYADGVVYAIYVFENQYPGQSLDAFIKDRSNKGYTWNRKSERKLAVDGATGKAFSMDMAEGVVAFFSKGTRLFHFVVLGAPQDDARITEFFSSVSLTKKTDALEAPENPPSPARAANLDAPEPIFAAKEVDKKFQVGMKVEPSYTETARQNNIEGSVVLKCVLYADGSIGDIRVVTGLPYGLTERAVGVARKIKFIPAMKDGKYVSISTNVIYYFNLY